MGNCMTFGSDSSALENFSPPHLFAIAAVLLLSILLLIFRNSFKQEKSRETFRYFFAAFIVLQQASIYIWYTVSGEWSVEVTLPLQLCDLSLFLSIAVLLTKRRLLFELLYYWGMGGAAQAILTPSIGDYTFPHFVFYQYFISHGVILLSCIYMIAVEKFRPSPRSVLRTFLITNLYALIIFPFNYLTGANYLFLNRKPMDGTLFDILGPWPWYLLSLEIVTFLVLILLYLPFAIGGNRKGKSYHSNLSS